ncbi:MAG: cytochrome c [Acidobacteria bacterium]|nr:MAG: cytochrome c [Acidobacteriota bacterium]REK04137.1 MAG: cytochrome c [Acidobacteriota bacterium]REK15299.1 MAG: cytochrome c [Acidobacteriota bacterium]REK46389.1 MAG: cytochrome c [Acidobacteriota bacterium]
MRKVTVFALLLFTFALSTACRYDMQDQPRLKPYKESDFFADGKAMRDLPEGTVARGQLKEDKAFYTGKKENADPNIQVETTTDASGNTLVSSFPNDIEEIPMPVTEEVLDRGEERYKIFCMVCHGPVGSGDGMVVRRGYPQPPTYHDDRLRNAPAGHFFDVMTNGWGKMNSYASMIPVADRWAIVAYIRALQASQNPQGFGNEGGRPATNSNTANEESNTNGTAGNTAGNGGGDQ